MRIKWSSIPRMNTPNASASWVATAATARVKYDVIEEQREREKREKERKTQRVIAWLRRSRW